MTKLPRKTFSGNNRPYSIGRFLICGDLTISVQTHLGDHWLALTDEDDLHLTFGCESLEEATGIL